MANTNYYENLFVISKDCEKNFEPFKQELTTIEKIGLEAVLVDFVNQYEQCEFGENYTNIEPYVRYNKDSVDILDGYSDTYNFNNYAIGEMKLTSNGIAIMIVADLDNYIGDDKELFEQYKGDYQELIDRFDVWCEFETRYIRFD